MFEVKIYPLGEDNGQYLYVVIATQYQGKWAWVKHRERDTWEIPGGHIEKDELADDAAKRELYEETGANKFTINSICDYSVITGSKESLSRLYFANVTEFGPLPESEIKCIDFFEDFPENLTYPEIQPILLNEVKKTMP